MIPRKDRDTIRKGNCRPVSFKNVNAKALNNISTKQTQQHMHKNRSQPS